MSDEPQEIVTVDDAAAAPTEVEVVDVPATQPVEPDQLADRVSWIINLIADKGYVPGSPERAWAGRQDIVADVAQRFDASAESAGEMVREAHNALRLADPALSDKEVRRRLQLERLENLRQMVLRACNEKVVETTYAFEEAEGEGELAGKKVFKRRKVKEKVSPADLAAYSGRLLSIYQMENDLLGLTGAGADAATATREILREMEETVDEHGQSKKTLKQSVVNSVRLGNMALLHPQSQERYLETIRKAAEQAHAKKKVESTEAGKTTA